MPESGSIVSRLWAYMPAIQHIPKSVFNELWQGSITPSKFITADLQQLCWADFTKFWECIVKAEVALSFVDRRWFDLICGEIRIALNGMICTKSCTMRRIAKKCRLPSCQNIKIRFCSAVQVDVKGMLYPLFPQTAANASVCSCHARVTHRYWNWNFPFASCNLFWYDLFNLGCFE